jgi:hypothetical protein
VVIQHQTLRCATSGKGETGEMGVSFVSCMSRSIKFGVRSSEHLKLRTSNPSPSRSSNLTRSAILGECSPDVPHD